MNRTTEEGLSILQINAQKQLDNLSILLREKDCSTIDIIATQEPPINPFSSSGNWKTHNPNTAIFDTYLPNSETAPLVCFLINKTTMDKTKISITERAGILISLDTEVEVQGELKRVSIHNIYNPCHLQNNQRIERGPFAGLPIDSALPHLEEALSKRSERENIVVGDFNLWHKNWFGNTDTRGREGRQARKLAEQMQEHGLQLCIPPGTVTRPTNKSDTSQGTTIDLVWASETVWNNIMECGVSMAHDCDSDHLPVLTRISCKKEASKNNTRRLLKQIDKEIFNKTLAEEMPRILAPRSKQEAEDIMDKIIRALQTAVEKSAPLAKVSPKSCAGLSEEARQAIKDCKAQRKNWENYRTEHHKSQYESAKRKKTASIRRSNREEHRQRVSDVRDEEGLWKLAK